MAFNWFMMPFSDFFVEGDDFDVKTIKKFSKKDLISDLQYARMKHKERKDTKFFQSLYSGKNLKSVKGAFIELRKEHSSKLYEYWFPNNKQYRKFDGSKPDSKTTGSKKFFRALLFVPMCMISTLIFYMVCTLILGILNLKLPKRKLSKITKLSLHQHYAALSGNKEIFKIFQEIGFKFDCLDENDNNIFHYLADLSIEKPDAERALKCYKVMINSKFLNFDPEQPYLYYMMLLQPNKNGLSPVHYVFRYGSFKLGVEMMKDIFKYLEHMHHENRQSKERFKENNSPKMQSRDESYRETTNKTKIDHTDYALRFWQEFRIIPEILQIIVEKPVHWTVEADDDFNALKKCSGISKWVRFASSKRLLIPSNVIDILVTILTLYLLTNEALGNVINSPLKTVFVNSHAFSFLNLWNQTASFNDTSLSNLQSQFFHKYPNILQTVENKEHTMDYREVLRLIRNIDGYENTAISTVEILYNHVCSPGNVFFSVNPHLSLDNCTRVASESLFPLCKQETVRYNYFFQDENIDPYEFVLSTSFGEAFVSTEFEKPFRYFVICIILIVYYSMYILLDFLYRVLALSNGNYLYGSYIRAQAMIFCGASFLTIFFSFLPSIVSHFLDHRVLDWVYIRDSILDYDTYSRTNMYNNGWLGLLLSLVYVSRFVIHLHNMINWPWIGSFALAAFYLGKDISRLAFVYVLSVIIFSVLFTTVDRNDTCPGWPDDDHWTFMRSLFNTYSISLGLLEKENYETDTVRTVHFIYSIFVIILLLNLLVAVLNRTHDRLSKDSKGCNSQVTFIWSAENFLGWLHCLQMFTGNSYEKWWKFKSSKILPKK